MDGWMKEWALEWPEDESVFWKSCRRKEDHQDGIHHRQQLEEEEEQKKKKRRSVKDEEAFFGKTKEGKESVYVSRCLSLSLSLPCWHAYDAEVQVEVNKRRCRCRYFHVLIAGAGGIFEMMREECREWCGGGEEGNTLTHFLLDVMIETEEKEESRGAVVITVSGGCDNLCLGAEREANERQ
ncbi:hypothetical protein Aperf_G00000100257 [Anoplocephala perfoliata]